MVAERAIRSLDDAEKSEANWAVVKIEPVLYWVAVVATCRVTIDRSGVAWGVVEGRGPRRERVRVRFRLRRMRSKERKTGVYVQKIGSNLQPGVEFCQRGSKGC
jgi:hypothetical protein